jgi:hypothetical protein
MSELRSDYSLEARPNNKYSSHHCRFGVNDSLLLRVGLFPHDLSSETQPKYARQSLSKVRSAQYVVISVLMSAEKILGGEL